MWNQWNTGAYAGMISELTAIKGHNNDTLNAYVSRPLGPGPFPGVVLVHHLPGWDELYREFSRRFSEHGYLVICPNLYQRFGDGTPEEMAAAARAAGGASDDVVLGDCEAAAAYLRSLPISNGRVGIIGTCSGGRHAFMVSCRSKSFDALVECWGGNVVMAPDKLTEQQPVSPNDLTAGLSCPMLGIFGNDDQSPSPDLVNQHEAELRKHGKDYDFHRYDGAPHGFWYYDRGNYRPEQAMDSWKKTFEFFGKHLQA